GPSTPCSRGICGAHSPSSLTRAGRRLSSGSMARKLPPTKAGSSGSASSRMNLSILSSSGCNVSDGAKSMPRSILFLAALRCSSGGALHGRVGIARTLAQGGAGAVGAELADGLHGGGAHRGRERLVGRVPERFEDGARGVAAARERARAGDGEAPRKRMAALV